MLILLRCGRNYSKTALDIAYCHDSTNYSGGNTKEVGSYVVWLVELN